jgi:hypothetical protein
MGIVADTLISILQEHLDHHHVVVWFDPEKAYTTIVESLKEKSPIPDTTLMVYDPQKGFLALRRELEPVWRQEEPPRLLIYVPLASRDTQNALVEYILAGVQLEPGLHPPERNTRLAVIARRALEKLLPAATVEKIVADTEKGQLNLAEIESLAEHGQETMLGALSLVFKTGSAEEIALRFLTDPAIDKELAAKDAGPALASLLNDALGAKLGEGDDLAGLRAALIRHVLVTEFLSSIAGEKPSSLKTIPQPKSKAARQTAVQIVKTWRLRRDLSASYVQAAQKLEAELGVGSQTWTIEALTTCETFERTEKCLQTLVEKALTEKPSQDLLDLALQKTNSFWGLQNPEVRLRWQVIADAAQAFMQSEPIRQVLKGELSATALFKRYTEDNKPSQAAWCNLDTAQRRLERELHNLDLDPKENDTTLKLVAAAQLSYAETVHLLASRFIRTYEQAGFTMPGVVQQADIYHDFVEPSVSEASVAYFLVDAFRFEMARELCAQFPEDWKAELQSAVATPPTITEVGMAGLMPGAEKGLAIGPAGSSKLGVTVLGNFLKGRSDRVKHLESKAPAPVAVVELNQIAPLKDKNIRNNLKSARLIVVTATDEIDGLWEHQPAMARQLHEHVFDQLRRGLRALFGLGIFRAVLTADHGFLIGDRLMQGVPLDAPGGDTADLHRRVWVGKGGAAVPECLRKPLSAFGIGGDLELVTPYGMMCFKTPGGSTEYFHGGLSLQEMAIPVLTVTAGEVKASLEIPAFHWTVTPGSKQISTRFFSVTVQGQATDLFAMPPRVRVELRGGSQIYSVPIAASYGFDEVTRDVTMAFEAETRGQLTPNTITLQITDVPEADKVKVFLLDELGASLCPEIDVPISISI